MFDITEWVVSLVLGGILVIGTWLAKELLKLRQAERLDAGYRLLEDFVGIVVAGLEQQGRTDPLLATGEAKLAEALALVEQFAKRMGLEYDEAAIAHEVRLMIEARVFGMPRMIRGITCEQPAKLSS